MKVLGKLENIKLCKIECDFDISWRDYEGKWTIIGWATYKIGLKKHQVKFGISENKKPQPIFYFEDYKCIIPENELQREALLVLIYGEFQKYQGRIEILNFFKKRRYEEEQEKKRKIEEEKRKKIELGEQINFEKYLLNQ